MFKLIGMENYAKICCFGVFPLVNRIMHVIFSLSNLRYLYYIIKFNNKSNRLK